MPRMATINRKTAETAITAAVNLDGTGRSASATGIGFFDHMIDQLARHSLIDIELACAGDRHIDDHHSVEDCGIALGQALARALGDKRGIRRYGAFHLAMDDALVRAALRELAEETGLALSPDAGNPLLFVFRAITPPGRTRRFDARFFLIEARQKAGAGQDFTAACDELSHLHWVPLSRARELDLPFITEVVLAEVAALIAAASEGPLLPPARVPFFDNSSDESRLVHLP